MFCTAIKFKDHSSAKICKSLLLNFSTQSCIASYWAVAIDFNDYREPKPAAGFCYATADMQAKFITYTCYYI